jgi:hypothetical protein
MHVENVQTFIKIRSCGLPKTEPYLISDQNGKIGPIFKPKQLKNHGFWGAEISITQQFPSTFFCLPPQLQDEDEE